MIVCAAVALLVARTVRAEITPPVGPVRTYVALDQLRRTHDTRFTLEEWTYTIELDDGTTLFVTFAYSNLWFLSPSVAIEASVVRPGEEAVLYGGRASADGYREDPASGRIELTPRAFIEGVPPREHRIHAESDWHDGLVLDLRFSDMWPGFVVGDGIFRVGDDPDARVQLMVASPRASVEGTLTTGDRTQHVRGFAVAEHGFYSKELCRNSLIHRAARCAPQRSHARPKAGWCPVKVSRGCDGGCSGSRMAQVISTQRPSS